MMVTCYRRWLTGQGIDNKGFGPDVKMDFDKAGWLEEVPGEIVISFPLRLSLQLATF
ncbi:hypothetical protein [Chitinophaga niastensis]|uniref:hypothetical protein n=1 Tax=Chitinophaga niastensis TaxID=536980 RepID=UPI001304B91F|nr:hypothetical protein [Chitinophaga niastensis]